MELIQTGESSLEVSSQLVALSLPAVFFQLELVLFTTGITRMGLVRVGPWALGPPTPHRDTPMIDDQSGSELFVVNSILDKKAMDSLALYKVRIWPAIKKEFRSIMWLRYVSCHSPMYSYAIVSALLSPSDETPLRFATISIFLLLQLIFRNTLTIT